MVVLEFQISFLSFLQFITTFIRGKLYIHQLERFTVCSILSKPAYFMKKIFSLICLFAILTSANAQEKYQSLFWKITSDKSAKPSYLYGTMHVSNKIAYHLSDEFYQALKAVDYVALESDPNEWLEAFEDGRMAYQYSNNQNYYNGVGFYRAFKPFEITDEVLKYYLSQDKKVLNGILYRNNVYQADFQEDTYLDMFIYQAGHKLNKKFSGLEDYDISNDMVTNAMIYANNDDELDPWLKKLLKEKSYVQLMEDAYRDQDLDFLDSLNEAYNTEEYNKYMLVDRNRIMANSIDSIIELGSVFSGIGAAHLPGDSGVIEMLRGMGYTLEPINGDLTEVGKSIRKEIDKTFNVKKFTNQKASDDMFTVNWLNKLYEFSGGVLVSPDLTNGGYVLVSRINKHNQFYNEVMVDLEHIDELLFENVPGDIISKKEIERNGFKGIDLLNKTKNGNHQRYHIFETPLEVLVFKMDGPQKYVVEHGDDFFNSIDIKALSNKSTKIKGNFGNFDAQLPAFYKNMNAGGFASRIDYPYVQAFDKKDSSYYFIINAAHTDYVYLEEDDFEEKMIHKRIYEEFKLDDHYDLDYSKHQSKSPMFMNDSIFTGDTLFLYTSLSANQYYLLGYLGKDAATAQQFFNSFELNGYDFPDEMEAIEDTVLHYSVTTFGEPPYHNLQNMIKKDEQQKKRKYEKETKLVYYTSPAKEKVRLHYTRFPLYEYHENVDSLWSYYLDKLLDFDNNTKMTYSNADKTGRVNLAKMKLLKKEHGKLDGKFPTMDVYLGREGSTKYVRKLYVLNRGVLFTVTTMLDSLYQPSEFVNTFYETFLPKDSTIGYSPFEDHTTIFFDDIASADTLRKKTALKNIYRVPFKEEHLSKVSALIDTFQFDEEELDYKNLLIRKVGKMNSAKANQYLVDLYKSSGFNAVVQMEIIEALADQNKPANTKLILDLLDYDIPLAYDYVIDGAFNAYYDSLDLAVDLYPGLLKYANINEYKGLVYSLLANMKSKQNYNAKKYKKFKELLITEARMELKRLKQVELQGDDSYYASSDSEDMLYAYVTLLAPFYSDPQVAKLFEKLNTVDNINTLVHLITTQKAAGNNYNLTQLKKIMEEKENVSDVALALDRKEEFTILKKLNISQEDIAVSRLYDSADGEVDSYEILHEENLDVSGRDFKMYVFKYKLKEDDSYNSYSYYSSSKKDKPILGAICFWMDKDKNGALQPYSYYSDLSNYNTMLIEDDEEEEEDFYKKTVDAIEFLGRKRVQVEEEKYGGY